VMAANDRAKAKSRLDRRRMNPPNADYCLSIQS
jgi:hypothetical protein